MCCALCIDGYISVVHVRGVRVRGVRVLMGALCGVGYACDVGWRSLWCAYVCVCVHLLVRCVLMGLSVVWVMHVRCVTY